ncbi:hypothetical protein, partial [Elizabethkingia anophelis]|uniref:hypothetical protein n=1 Tax=Elizabethkingia anophelis TaxID=1117645 RepID=UPI0038929BE9
FCSYYKIKELDKQQSELMKVRFAYCYLSFKTRARNSLQRGSFFLSFCELYPDTFVEKYS